MSAILVTQEGVCKMQAELARLEVLRDSVIERMRRAWEHGGISPGKPRLRRRPAGTRRARPADLRPTPPP
jgi:hypothetical protein